MFFFFQAEAGIRDADVTGVQTCALPISILFGLRRALAGSPEPPTESSSLCPPIRADGVTDWWFTSSCSPPGDMAPMQLLSVTGPTVSARSGTFTLLFQCALRRTSAELQFGTAFS